MFISRFRLSQLEEGSSIQIVFCQNWSSYDAQSWRHFAFSREIGAVGYVLGFVFVYCKYCSVHLRTIPPLSPSKHVAHSPSHAKLPAVTHAPNFMTACRLSSWLRAIAGPVSAKNHWYTTKDCFSCLLEKSLDDFVNIEMETTSLNHQFRFKSRFHYFCLQDW